MIVTVFRSRLMPGVREEYVALVDRMIELAKTMPGYISHKGFFADDGERGHDRRVRIARKRMRAWRMHPRAPRGAEARRAKSIIPNISVPGLRGEARGEIQARGTRRQLITAVNSTAIRRSR